MIDISKSLITSSTSGAIRDLELLDVHMGASGYAQRWETLAFAVNSGLGGILGNSVVLLPGIVLGFEIQLQKTINTISSYLPSHGNYTFVPWRLDHPEQNTLHYTISTTRISGINLHTVSQIYGQ